MIVTTILQTAQLAVLARLLSKADFGLMAMILVVIGLGQAYADMGLSNAIIWRQDATRNQLSSLYWLNIMVGIAVFAVLVLLTPWIASFYRQPRLEYYLPLSAAIFLIIPFGQQFQVLLQKTLRFKALGVIEMSAAAVGAAAAMIAAAGGLGLYALILGQLTGAAVRTAILAMEGWTRWRPAVRLRLTDLRGYMRFGLFQMGERSVNQLTANLDYLVVGRYLGATVLGIYSVAYELVVLPFQKINPVLTRVAFPVFALRQTDDRAVGKGYCRLNATLVFAVFPLMVGLLVTAPVAVPVIFGPRWPAAVPLVQVLSLMAMLKTLTNPSGSLLLAKGRADLGFTVNLLAAGLTLAVFLAIVRFGPLAIAWGWVGMSLLWFVVWQRIALRLIHLAWKEYLGALARPLLLTVLAGFGLECTYFGLRQFMDTGILFLSVLVAAGVFIHLATWLLFNRQFVASTFAMLKTARGAAP